MARHNQCLTTPQYFLIALDGQVAALVEQWLRTLHVLSRLVEVWDVSIQTVKGCNVGLDVTKGIDVLTTLTSWRFCLKRRCTKPFTAKKLGCEGHFEKAIFANKKPHTSRYTSIPARSHLKEGVRKERTHSPQGADWQSTVTYLYLQQLPPIHHGQVAAFNS